VLTFPLPSFAECAKNGALEVSYWDKEVKNHEGWASPLVVAQLSGSRQQMRIGQSRIIFGDRQTGVLIYVTADGKRIILAGPTNLDSVKPLTLITNWTAGLKK
jgi:hypothetical protein